MTVTETLTGLNRLPVGGIGVEKGKKKRRKGRGKGKRVWPEMGMVELQQVLQMMLL